MHWPSHELTSSQSVLCTATAKVQFFNQRWFKSASTEEIWFSVHKKCSGELLHNRHLASGSLPAPLVSWCIIVGTEVACLAGLFPSEPFLSPPRAFATVVTHVLSRYPMSNSPGRNLSTLSFSVSLWWLITKFHKTRTKRVAASSIPLNIILAAPREFGPQIASPPVTQSLIQAFSTNKCC